MAVSEEAFEELKDAFEEYRLQTEANIQYLNQIILRHKHSLKEGRAYDPSKNL